MTSSAAHILGEIVTDKVSAARSLVRVFSHHEKVRVESSRELVIKDFFSLRRSMDKIRSVLFSFAPTMYVTHHGILLLHTFPLFLV